MRCTMWKLQWNVSYLNSHAQAWYKHLLHVPGNSSTKLERKSSTVPLSLCQSRYIMTKAQPSLLSILISWNCFPPSDGAFADSSKFYDKVSSAVVLSSRNSLHLVLSAFYEYIQYMLRLCRLLVLLVFWSVFSFYVS